MILIGAVHTALQPVEAAKFQPLQEKASQTVLQDILKDPEAHQSKLFHYIFPLITVF